MRPLLISASRAGVVLAALAFTGCTDKESLGPNEPCATSATVRFCHGRTAVCDTEHTTLELADGYRVRPIGKVWQAYLPQQVDGQVLTIGYKRIICNDIGLDCIDEASLSCLETEVLR